MVYAIRRLVVFLPLCLVVASASVVDASGGTATSDSRPNIVVLLCDDLGYGDPGFNGHPVIRTPHLDALASGGVRFTSYYSPAPVCSPSRAGLLTGRSPNRAGIYDWIPVAGQPRPDAREQVHLRRSEITWPQLLQRAGYASCMAGKWHCNSRFNQADQPQPGDAGFDHWMATQNNAGPSHQNPANFVRNGTPAGPLTGFSCQLVVDEAGRWLTNQRTVHPEQPFVMYLAFHEPHEPVASPESLVDLYLPLAVDRDQAEYFANVHNVDLAVGRIVRLLEEQGVRDNTLIVFTSDNGPETLNRYKTANRSWGRTGILRGMKLHTHDGGFHVAGLMNWPAGIRPGQVVADAVSSLDLFPTVCELAGIEPPADRLLDGISLVPLFATGVVPDRARPLLWSYYNSLNEARVAMRHGPWKVLARLNGGELPRFENLTPEGLSRVQSARLTDFEIYNLAADPGETLNLAGRGLAEEAQLVDLCRSEYAALAVDSPAWIPAAGEAN